MLDLIKLQDNMPFEDVVVKLDRMARQAWSDAPRFAPYKPCIDALKAVWETTNIMRAWLIYKDGRADPVGYVIGFFQQNLYTSAWEFNVLSMYIHKKFRRLRVTRELINLLRDSVNDRAEYIKICMPDQHRADREHISIVRV